MSEQEWIDIFGDNLKEILEEYGYSQQDFADSINVSKSVVSKIINKKTMPTVKTLINMCLELGLMLDDFAIFGDRID